MSTRVIVVAGARPNFMKAAPLIRAAGDAGFEALLVHTGQHYDEGMSQVFLDELGLPHPKRHLEVGSGSHGEVTARCLERLEQAFVEEKPDWVLVVGDVNSTMAGALAATKLGIRLAHVEAGLRSFDRTMPEEINRVVTDAVADLLLVSEPAGVANLRAEGHADEAICLVGNVMIDTLEHHLPAAHARAVAKRLQLPEGGYALVTLHRPSNVDNPADLSDLVGLLERVSRRLPLFFPVHPRTRAQLERMNLWPALEKLPGVRLAEPMGYLDFLSLLCTARVALTDSGGIQEETTALGVPCLTMRDNTERPITTTEGTNQLVGARGDRLEPALDRLLGGEIPRSRRPALWDGHAAERIMHILKARS